MTKLKFDRTINVVLEGKEEVRVPKDELWKVSLTGVNLQINYFTATNPNARYSYIPGAILGGGTSIFNYDVGAPCSVTGIAFKIIN